MFPFTFNNKELEAIIKNEGLLYAVTSYTNGEPIEDKKIRQLWEKVHSDIHFLQDFLADGREVPGYIIYKNGKYVILADRGNSHVPLSKYSMDEYVKTKIHEPLMEILKRLGMDKSDYGKEYAHGGTPHKATKTMKKHNKNNDHYNPKNWDIIETNDGYYKGWAFSNHSNVTSALYKNETRAQLALDRYLETGELEIQGDSDEKLEYAHGGTTPTAWKRFLNWLNEEI